MKPKYTTNVRNMTDDEFDDYLISIVRKTVGETQQEEDIWVARANGEISEREIRDAGFGHLLD